MTRTEQRRRAKLERKQIVHLRGYSGPHESERRAPSVPPTYSPRLGDRVGLVMVAAAAVGVMPESFGLGAYLIVQGGSVLDGGLTAPDGLDPEAVAAITVWAEANPLETVSGVQPWKVQTLTEFYDPHRGVFAQVAYCGAGPVIGADLPRVFGLMAEHVVNRTGRNVDSSDIWMPGWGAVGERRNVRRKEPHRGCLRARDGRIEFGPVERGNGKYVGSKQYRGTFEDLQLAARALDADRPATFSEHRQNFGLAPCEMSLAVPVDAQGAEAVVEAVAAVHELAVTLDEHAAQWFTTSTDRAEGRGRLDLSRLASAGGIAQQIVNRFGIRAPAATFRLSDDEERAWRESSHGGWISSDPRFEGTPFRAVTADVSSAFPLIFHLIGGWDLLCAERIVRHDVAAELRDLCKRVAADPTIALDPATWRRFGCCLVEVDPSGAILPIEVEDERRPDGRLLFVPVFSPDRPLYYSALDVIAAVVAGTVPNIISATAYRPVGRQEGLRPHLSILPGLVADIDHDPVPQLVARRRKAKANGDTVMAAQLRVLVNALVFGNFARSDEVWLTDDQGRRVRSERPGPLNCFATASPVTAGSHLLLAVGDRQVRDLGGAVAYMNTDSSIIPASLNGCDLTLSNGTTIHQLSWAEVDRILGAFDRLAPDPDWRVWKANRGAEDQPLEALIFGINRHLELVGGRITDISESELGGTYADPPGMRGRLASGLRSWSLAAILREVDYAAAKRVDPENAVKAPAPWDIGAALPFPALRRLMVKTPEMAKRLPKALGARPGTRYLQATGVGAYETQTVVTLDPGGAPADWASLHWVNTRSGCTERVTTDFSDYGAFTIRSLADQAGEWSRRARVDPIESVTVDPDLIVYSGRLAGMIDANADGLGDLRSRRPIHQDANRLAAVQSAALEIGPRAFSRLTGLPLKVAERASLGKPISASNVTKALRALKQDPAGRHPTCAVEGCTELIARPNQRYCSPACKAKAYRLSVKQKAERIAKAPKRKGKPANPVPELKPVENLCHCGTALFGAGARRGTCSTCAKAMTS